MCIVSTLFCEKIIYICIYKHICVLSCYVKCIWYCGYGKKMYESHQLEDRYVMGSVSEERPQVLRTRAFLRETNVCVDLVSSFISKE